MDAEIKLLFGKILGEIYRLQMHTEGMKSGGSPGRIYGLLNGLETEIEAELAAIPFIPKEKYYAVADVLEEYYRDDEKMKKFTGYYTIEGELSRRGVSRSEAMVILTEMKANRRFVELIAKMDSSHSPGECRTFEIDEFNK